jgi:hypothetical protein
MLKELGAGSAATGTGELISLAMARRHGLGGCAKRPRRPVRHNGLVVVSQPDLANFQKPFATDTDPGATFVEAMRDGIRED